LKAFSIEVTQKFLQLNFRTHGVVSFLTRRCALVSTVLTLLGEHYQGHTVCLYTALAVATGFLLKT